MKYKYLFLGLLLSIFFIFILNASLQAKNQRENDCLDGFTNPSKAEKVECKLKGRGFMAEGEFVGKDRHGWEERKGHDPATLSEDEFQSRRQVHFTHLNATASAYPAGSGRADISIRVIGTSTGNPSPNSIGVYEVWGPTGVNFNGGNGYYCKINSRDAERFSPPYECIEDYKEREGESDDHIERHHVLITKTSIFMKRLEGSGWTCTFEFFGCHSWSHAFVSYPGENNHNNWGNINAGTVYRWDFNL